MKNINITHLKETLPSWVKSLAIDRNGKLWGCSGDKSLFMLVPMISDNWVIDTHTGHYIQEVGYGYNTKDWQKSPINLM